MDEVILHSDVTKLYTYGKVHICHAPTKKINLDCQDKTKKKNIFISDHHLSLLRCIYVQEINISVSLHSSLMSQRFVDPFPCRTA